MADAISNSQFEPVGQAWLHLNLKLQCPAPAVESFVGAGARRSETSRYAVREFYPKQYNVEPTVVAHLRFALKYEAFDMGVLVAALQAIEPSIIENWVRAEPTGEYSRRTWFLFETFAGKLLELDDAVAGNYVAALDPELHVVAERRNSARHRVIDNLLGGAGCCVSVRRTKTLLEKMEQGLDMRARELTDGYEPAVLARAIQFLYTKETRSSFAIEKENPSPRKAELFIAALEAAPGFQIGKASLVELQNAIVDPRFAEDDWRKEQNFVGETIGFQQQKVHFVCPRPDDLADLMEAWMRLAARTAAGGVDPVVSAAIVAFAFVFLHPFEDGNGRIHRFLIHHVLANRAYGPPGIIFPVSAAIVRDKHLYDEVLETFSNPIMEFIDWHWTQEESIEVENRTDKLYRYFDGTAFAEYLYDRVGDTIERDLKEELGFLSIFDRAMEGVLAIVEMPDRDVSLFVRLCLQNGGRLSEAKRGRFAKLTDVEVRAMEEAVRAAI